MSLAPPGRGAEELLELEAAVAAGAGSTGEPPAAICITLGKEPQRAHARVCVLARGNNKLKAEGRERIPTILACKLHTWVLCLFCVQTKKGRLTLIVLSM